MQDLNWREWLGRGAVLMCVAYGFFTWLADLIEGYVPLILLGPER